jgi:SWIRM-associated domain at the N-terminal/SWIRM domain/Myb-like DNA-binding domain/Zinc finger, ZZ type
MAPRLAGRRSVLGESVRAARSRAGQPYMRKYDDGRLFLRFTAISRAIRADGYPQGLVTERELSRLTGRLLAFSDAALGRDANPADRAGLTKLPARLFFDYAAKGSLRVILESCLRFAAQRGWAAFDLREPARREDHLAMLRACERALRAEKMMTVAMVYFSASLSGAEVQKLRAIVQAHGGAVVSSADVATHVVYPDPPGRSEAESDGQVMVRLLKREGKPGGVRALVHWYYHPDTYDDWIMAREVRGHVEPEPPERGSAPWHVAARWLRDLDVFNEWMNEADYEMPEEFDAYEGRQPQFVVEAKAAKRGPGGPESRSIRLRLRMSDDESIAPAAKRMRIASDGVKLVGLPSVGSAREDSGGLGSGREPERERAAEQEAVPRRSLRAAGRAPVDVEGEEARKAEERRPRYSTWFDIKRVHEIERNALPEFFSGRYKSKNEGVYLQTRNFMIQTWLRSPLRYLSATAARRNLRGDAPAIQRIQAFLEHWGLINYNVLPETRPPQIHVPPPPPLPVLAGRVDLSTGERQSILFLEDGSPVDIFEDRVRRVALDGLPGFESESEIDDIVKSRLPGVPGATDSPVNGILTPLGPGSGLPQASPFETPNASYPGMSNEMGDSGMMSNQRPVRSTRYSSRQRRVSRYVDHSSDDDDMDDDDDVDEDEGEEDATKEAAMNGNADGNGNEDDAERDGDIVEYHCDICAKDCTDVRYHCTQHADMDVCTSCYTDRKYPASLQARDFIQMSATPAGPDDGWLSNDPLVWSESENLLLLEALEMYGENWEMVAEHVESKDSVQCILQFLRLPIEDDFLDELREQWWPQELCVASGANGTGAESVAPSPADVLLKCGAGVSALQGIFDLPSSFTGQPLPFSDRIETIVPQVAVLASQVPRDVLAMVMSELDAAMPQMEVDGQDLDDRNVDFDDNDGNSSTDDFVTDRRYHELLGSVKAVCDFAVTERGTRAAALALEELSRGKEYNPVEVGGPSLKPATTPSSRRRVSRKVSENSEASKADFELDAEDADALASTDTESTQAVATTAMASGAMRARELLDLEERELRRLQTLLFELKLGMIRMKLEHFHSICRHHSASQAASRRQLQVAIGTMCKVAGNAAKGHLSEGDEKIFVLPSGSPSFSARCHGPARRTRPNADVDVVKSGPGSCLVRTALKAPHKGAVVSQGPSPVPKTNFIVLGTRDGQVQGGRSVVQIQHVAAAPEPPLFAPSTADVEVDSTIVINGPRSGGVVSVQGGATRVPAFIGEARIPEKSRNLSGNSVPARTSQASTLSIVSPLKQNGIGAPVSAIRTDVLSNAGAMVQKINVAPVDARKVDGVGATVVNDIAAAPDANGGSATFPVAQTVAPRAESQALGKSHEGDAELTAKPSAANASVTTNGSL